MRTIIFRQIQKIPTIVWEGKTMPSPVFSTERDPDMQLPCTPIQTTLCMMQTQHYGRNYLLLSKKYDAFLPCKLAEIGF